MLSARLRGLDRRGRLLALLAATACGAPAPGDDPLGIDGVGQSEGAGEEVPAAGSGSEAPPTRLDAAEPASVEPAQPSGEGANPAAPGPEQPSVPEPVPQASEGGPTPESTGCVAGAGVSAAPESFEELSALIDSLPKPTTLPCLIASLERPLGVFFTSSGFSAQPADGARSPRTFITLGPLVLSVVPGGPVGHLLEVGLRTGPGRSIKAELEFPVRGQITAERWHERVALGAGGTVCGGCHSAEEPGDDPFYDDGFASTVIVPDLRYAVSLDRVRGQAERCDPFYEPERCALFDALLSHGPVEERVLDFGE